MIDWSVLVTAIAGVIGTVGGSWGSYIFTKKKYNVEVDSAKIANLEHIIDIQNAHIENLSKRLDTVLKRNEQLEKQIVDLRRTVYNLMSSMCKDFTCSHRRIDDLEDPIPSTSESVDIPV